MMSRKGVYDIIMTFFLVILLIFGVLIFLYLNARSAVVFGGVARTSAAPRSAAEVKDAVLSCHRLEYLDETLMNAPCYAKDAYGGYRVRQLALNGCTQKVWDFRRSIGDASTIPFIVAVEQQGGKRCLAALEVFVPAETPQ